MIGKRGGRRPGQTSTREQILAAARAAFGARGYDAATIREIAAVAGVDSAMISHHFGGKEALFLATIDFPFDPRDYTSGVLDGPTDQLAERLLRQFLLVWDAPEGAAATATLRTAMQHEWSAGLLRQFLLTRALQPLIATLEPDADRAAWRGSLVASQLVGLALARYIIKFPPLSTAPQEVVIAALAPTLQRYLTGEVPGLEAGQEE